MRSHDIVLLQGPPGTGKTTTIIGIITIMKQYFTNYKKLFQQRMTLSKDNATQSASSRIPKILVCAPSNQAVD